VLKSTKIVIYHYKSAIFLDVSMDGPPVGSPCKSNEIDHYCSPSHPRVKSRVRIGRWRSDALLQCRCSERHWSNASARHRLAVKNNFFIFRFYRCWPTLRQNFTNSPLTSPHSPPHPISSALGPAPGHLLVVPFNFCSYPDLFNKPPLF